MMLKWVTNNCDGKVNFLMKCDDDTFVNVPNLIHYLLGGTIPVYEATLQRYNSLTVKTLSEKNRLKSFKNLLIGTRFCHSKPITNYQSQWFTPSYMYSGESFPIYLFGAGYVLTMDTAKQLYNLSMDIQLMHLEDVYLTGLCAEQVHIARKDHPLFTFRPHKKWCEYRGMITLHEIIPSDMILAYDFVINPNITCKLPIKYARVKQWKKDTLCE